MRFDISLMSNKALSFISAIVVIPVEARLQEPADVARISSRRKAKAVPGATRGGVAEGKVAGIKKKRDFSTRRNVMFQTKRKCLISNDNFGGGHIAVPVFCLVVVAGGGAVLHVVEAEGRAGWVRKKGM